MILMMLNPHFQLAVIAAHFAEVLSKSYYSPSLEVQDLLIYTSMLTEELGGDEDVIEFVSLIFDAYYLQK